jgi:anhydro-N-acetylmuramic acid kinase
MDGVDAALVRFEGSGLELIGANQDPWPVPLAEQLRELATPGNNEIDRLGVLDAQAGEFFADSVLRLLQQAGVDACEVRGIGSHGQTLRHRPHAAAPFTLQIGDPNRIAQLTGITTVADFRRRDMAVGGQGAPLAPAFHADFFGSNKEARAVLNLGGIANLTLLPGSGGKAVTGFDTGPANTLLDRWSARVRGLAMDANGEWAASGKPVPRLLSRLLEDPYFSLPPPKSTGPEYFSLEWLRGRWPAIDELEPADVQATLLALTVESVAQALERHAPECKVVVACGGGAFNPSLMERLAMRIAPRRLANTSDYGLAPDLVEAVAFAWLARRTLSGQAGNLPEVTGAHRPVVLGGIYPPC